jgi:hypothetical protein
LDEDGLALARALDRGTEDAVRAIRDPGFHRPTDDLGDEHALVQAVAQLDRDPLETVVLGVLRIAEGASRRLELD